MKKTAIIITTAITAILILMICAGCAQENKPNQQEKQETASEQNKDTQQGNQETQQPETDQKTASSETALPEKAPEEPPTKETPSQEQTTEKPKTLLIFHNGHGPMCIEALNFLEKMKKKYPKLNFDEHLTTTAIGMNKLIAMEREHSYSQGVSSTFGYLPIIFINEKAYSGFASHMEQDIEKDIKEVFG